MACQFIQPPPATESRRTIAIICLLTALVAGCRRGQEELVYVSSADVETLSGEQQAKVRTWLTRFYGTPANPRLMVLDVDALAEKRDAETSANELDIPIEETLDADHLKLGAAVYRQRCASCHGVTGDGNGPAAQYLDPKPRDYRKGIFKFTSTGRNKPRKVDLIRTVKYGARGTSMPSFRWLPQKELSAVVDYVILLAQRGETESKLAVLLKVAEEDELEDEETFLFAHEDAKTVYDAWINAEANLIQPATPPPPMTEEAILRGRQAFLVTGCAKCHGTKGEGYTSFAMTDDWGNEIHAADLTSGMFHGGRREIDIYRRIYAGINGTPMPASGPEFAPTFRGDEGQLWDLTYYALALSQGRKFPYVSIEEANRMALEHSQESAAQPMGEVPMPDPMPEQEQPDGERPEETRPAGEEDDPRSAAPQPPTVENESDVATPVANE